MDSDSSSSSNRFVLRSAGVMSGLTMASRILGLVRDVVLSSIFGTTYVMDAFRVALMLPNLLRRLLAEGALTAAFVPTLTDFKNTHSREETGRFISTCFYTLAIVLAGLVVVGVLLAPVFVPLIMPEGGTVAGKWALTIHLTRLMFPYIFFISLAALAMGSLNTFKVFGPPMATPILLNLSIIGCTLFLYRAFDLPILAPVIGVLLGGFLQLTFQLPFLWRRGVGFRPKVSFRHPFIVRIGKLMVPGVFGSGVSQINTLVSVYFVSLAGDLAGVQGLQWVMYISGRLVEVVHGVYTVALSTALLPAMSEHAFERDMEKLHDKISYGLRMAFFLTLPATMGLVLLRHDIVRLIFQRGKFSSASTELTSNVLLYYAFCLVVWGGIYILTPAFYALKDIKTPVKIAAVAMIVNILANVALLHSLREGAPPLALVIAGAIQLVLLWVVFRSKYGHFPIRRLVTSLLRFVAGTLVMTAGLVLVARLPWAPVHAGLIVSTVWLAARIVLAAALYMGTLMLMGSPEWRFLMDQLRRKLRG